MKKGVILFCFSLLTSTFTYAVEEPNYKILDSKENYPLLNPTLSERKTAKVILNNGVQAYLISDPKTEQSAAAVCMEAGSWEDPEQYPGTAHFTEHMLFMGTKAYPDEAEYMKYIQDNGGAVNAFTASDRTVYMFSINNDAFLNAFDRFSHFFIDPLFSPSSINRELHAVDQEFAKNVENDFWRSYMVLKEISRKEHPNIKFSTGNAKTLSGIPQDALKDWFNTYYRPEKMHVAILSPLPIEELISETNAKFSILSRKQTPLPSSYGPIFSQEQKGHFVYIKPVKDLKILSLVWELPKEFANIEQKWTSHLISYIFNDASDKSLFAELKKQKLAESIASSSDAMSKDDRLFTIDITLTEQGLCQLDTVISLCNQTIARIKQTGVPLSLFREVETMAKIRYQYQSRQDPFSWITDIASCLPEENLATFPEKTYIPTSFDPESLSGFLSCLTPESCIYLVLADPERIGVTIQNTEKWMQVPYTLEEIAPSKLLSWKQVAPNPAIQIPTLNPYLPTSLELLTASTSEESSTVIPTKILKTEKSEIYFAQDQNYHLPESAYIFNIKTPSIDGSASSKVLTDLYFKALEDKLSSNLFFANHAGLSCNLFVQNLNFRLQIAGYSEKASLLTEEVFATLKNISCTQEQFALYKDSLASTYGNEASEIPMKQATVTAYNILLNDFPTGMEKEKALSALTYEDFTTFCENWLNMLYLEGVLYGNITKPLALELTEKLQKNFESSTPYKNPKKESLLILPENKGPFKVLQKTERQGNSTVLVIEEGPSSFSKKASQLILASALQEAFFDTLRTKQQTGYMVKSWGSEVGEQLLQTFAVQSSSHLPEDLLHRFELFLEDFNKRLSEIVTQDQFNLLKNTQITSLQIPPDTIYEMAAFLSLVAFEYNGDFTRKEKRIEALEKLSYEEFLQDANSFISKRNAKRLAILVEGQQLDQKPLQYAEIAKEDIVKIGTASSM